MCDELPTEYDVIIVGTGMVESILAGAVARIGKKVLHLDRNSYYGQLWATFSFEGLENWYLNNVSCNNSSNYSAGEVLKPDIIKNLTLHETELEQQTVSDLVYKWHCSELVKPAEEDSCNKSSKEWTKDKIKEISRKFNIDLSPKLIFCNGSMVKLLLNSHVSRYTEFVNIAHVLTYINNSLKEVPCSKSDVFATKSISMVDKRILMKILSLCLNNDENDTLFLEFQDKTFYEFLKTQNVPEYLLHYILYAIAMGSYKTTCSEALKSVKKFLRSLGCYGNSPFLWPLYGSSELLQAYCRLCAIYGGIYYLNRGVEALVVNEEFLCKGVLSNNQYLCAEHVIMSATLAPKSYFHCSSLALISRGILITDRPLYSEGKRGVSVLQFPSEGNKYPITIIELNSSSGACPDDLSVVHLSCRHVESAENDFKEIVNALFIHADSRESPLHNLQEDESDKEVCGKEKVEENESSDRPKILFSIYFSITDTSTFSVLKKPHNVHLCSGPDLGIDFDSSINQAKEIFETMYPGEHFLEPIPDPNENFEEK